MSIKTSVGELKPQKEKSFPKLMIRQDSEDYTLILATKKTIDGIAGIVLESNYDVNTIGQYSEDFNPKVFVDYNEPITIQNQ